MKSISELEFYAKYQQAVIPQRKTSNSLAHGKLEWNFRYVIFKQMLLIDGWDISCQIALIQMSMDFTDD